MEKSPLKLTSVLTTVLPQPVVGVVSFAHRKICNQKNLVRGGTQESFGTWGDNIAIGIWKDLHERNLRKLHRDWIAVFGKIGGSERGIW